MGIYINNNLPSVAKIISVAEFRDARGNLYVADNADLPFPVKRVFWIKDIPQDASRGAHAHKVCAEILFPVCGEFDVTVDDGTSSAVCHMQDPDEGLYVGPNVWCELNNFSEGAVCLVLCSHPYIKEGYINNYEEFKDFLNHQ